ncbi:MAG TPA: thiamine pyrophosphate-dependent enzyme [Polyangiaceae bacterium]|nr:thiamine pyrophosphate-dependent enzyme [Polyangiaceae bacterium]
MPPSLDPVLDDAERTALEALALRVREHIVRMSTRGGCFIGASLSCADLIAHLYARVLRVRPEALDDPERDYLLLSKGHDVPALYGTLAELGFFPKARLENHLRPNDYLYWHPNRAVPGVEFHSGSLGHLCAVGVGIALDIKMRRGKNRVFVILGDGELNEGSVWEALLVASAKRLDNLVAIIDRNQFQANVPTETLIPLEPLEDKFRAFGGSVVRVDGHDHRALARAFERVPRETERPTVVICDTVRGKGLPSIEARADRWFCNFTEREIQELLLELRGEQAAHIESEGLIVR